MSDDNITSMPIDADKQDDDATTTNPSSSAKSPTSSLPPRDIVDVTVHPLVLLSAADHYHRVARGTRKRVVGVLLGTVSRGSVDATNSFAVPFEEDSRNPAVFYLDHNYLEHMLAMFRKVNAKERVVGFYSTGPQIRPNDLRIYGVLKKFCSTPVFCIIDIRPDRTSLPTTAYSVATEFSTNPTFSHVPSTIGAMEAEEVGVEHLLRDINDPTVSTVASLVRDKLAGLDTLVEKLVECKDYLEQCAREEKKAHPDIVANLQTILNLLPNLNTDALVEAMLCKTNDMHMAIYLAALIRSVIALHDLINNKIRYGQHEEEQQQLEVQEQQSIGGIALKGGGEEKKEDEGDNKSEEKKQDEGDESKSGKAKK